MFDIDRIRQIITLMEQHDLSEVDLQHGDEKIKLNRGSCAPVVAAQLAPPPGAAPQALPPDNTGTGTGDRAATAGTITINSPMVGTFYARPNPDSDPFVKVGDNISEESIVCIVEAMKVFSEIPAECRGKIVEILGA